MHWGPWQSYITSWRGLNGVQKRIQPQTKDSPHPFFQVSVWSQWTFHPSLALLHPSKEPEVWPLTCMVKLAREDAKLPNVKGVDVIDTARILLLSDIIEGSAGGLLVHLYVAVLWLHPYHYPFSHSLMAFFLILSHSQHNFICENGVQPHYFSKALNFIIE